MKIRKILFVFALLFVFVSCEKNSSEKKEDVSDKTETKMQAPDPKEVGKAYGIMLASTVQKSEIKLDIEAMKKAYNEAIKKTVSDEEVQLSITVLNNAAKFSYNEKKERIKKEGEEFLSKNSKRPEVVTLESGLQYEILKEGTGKNATLDSTCKLNYVGTFIDGSEFENSHNYNNGDPVEIDLNAVITGWKEGITHMKEGGKYRLFIPHELAYGEQGIRSQMGEELIPPCSVLVFEIELVSVNETPQKAE